MGWPGRRATVRCLATGGGVLADQVKKVEMLGIQGTLPWEQDFEGLHVSLPDTKPCDYAYTLKIKLKAYASRASSNRSNAS